MFVIFGVGPKEKIEATGIFVCPRCKVKKEYRVKSSVEYFRLFFIPIFPTGEKKEFTKLKNVLFCHNISSVCKGVDLVVIHTEWEEFKALDFAKLSKRKKFKIYDMRNLYSPKLMKQKGFNYYSIGR